MTSVRFVFPKPRLAELLKEPGGLTVADAVQRARENLDAIQPTCAADLLALLELCEAGYATLREAYDEPAITQLYAIAVKGIGVGEVCGFAGVDAALTSFCDLLDSLRTLGRSDRDAVGVHVQSWRLLMTSRLPEAGVARVVDGLLKVSARYAAEARASGAQPPAGAEHPGDGSEA